MRVRDMMTADPICCTPDTPLQDVAKMMAERDCGAIPVVRTKEGCEPVGIVTDRDIVCRTVAAGANPARLRAQDAMTDHIIAAGASADVQDCCDMMERNQVRRLAVVDEEGRLRGILSQADLARQAPESEVGRLLQHLSRPSA